MTDYSDGHRHWRRRDALVLAAVLVFGVVVYAAGVPANPPGFHLDESSVAFNAHSVATTGRDEHGTAWTLFFRAFGEYKNPVYIYLLAAVFKLTGPSITAARLLSAALGVATALVLGLLARRMTGQRESFPLVMLMALLTPWLFELSRLVFEVALFPLALALLLLWLHRAAARGRWSWTDAAGLAALLALVTYTYSIGRLLGPLLALGLVLFGKRAGLSKVLSAWALYALALAPACVFQLRHPGALTGRFRIITYLDTQPTHAAAAGAFLEHYARNLDPWRMLMLGDPDINQLTQIEGCGLVLVLTGALAALGLWRVVRARRRDPWWLYVLYGIVVSPVPASLTRDYFHTLRLSPLPVFVIVLSIAGLEWFLAAGVRHGKTRLVAVCLVLLVLPQPALFLWKFHRDAHTERRLHLLDADYERAIFWPALAATPRPVYLADAVNNPGYVQAYWYATLRGVPLTEFKRLADDELPPAGAVTITTEEECRRCRVLAASVPYILYVTEQSPRPRGPLPDGALRAELSVPQPPATLRAGERATVNVRVRNAGDEVWLGRERAGARFQVMLGNHWLGADGVTYRNDDGRAPLLSDLAPREETELPLVINAPLRPGEYMLEIDVLQEGVSWFGLKGSKTTRLRVKVE